MKQYKRQGGEASRASGSVVILIAPALVSSLIFNYFGVGALLGLLFNTCLFLVWGLIFEKDCNFDKSFLNSIKVPFSRYLKFVPIYSLFLSLPFYLGYYLNSVVFGSLSLIVLMIVAFISALKAEYSKTGRDFQRDFDFCYRKEK